MPKNPHAVSLGRMRSPKKTAAARRNALLGGQPRKYRILPDGSLQKREGERWITLEPPYPRAARAFLQRQR